MKRKAEDGWETSIGKRRADDRTRVSRFARALGPVFRTVALFLSFPEAYGRCRRVCKAFQDMLPLAWDARRDTLYVPVLCQSAVQVLDKLLSPASVVPLRRLTVRLATPCPPSVDDAFCPGDHCPRKFAQTLLDVFEHRVTAEVVEVVGSCCSGDVLRALTACNPTAVHLTECGPLKPADHHMWYWSGCPALQSVVVDVGWFRHCNWSVVDKVTDIEVCGQFPRVDKTMKEKCNWIIPSVHRELLDLVATRVRVGSHRYVYLSSLPPLRLKWTLYDYFPDIKYLARSLPVQRKLHLAVDVDVGWSRASRFAFWEPLGRYAAEWATWVRTQDNVEPKRGDLVLDLRKLQCKGLPFLAHPECRCLFEIRFGVRFDGGS